MTTIIEFFYGIGDAIVSVFDFIVGFFSDFVYMIQLTGIFIAQIPSYFSWLPYELLTLIIIIFGVVVLYKIFGREG